MTPATGEARRAIRRRHNKTEKGRASRSRYKTSDRGRTVSLAQYHRRRARLCGHVESCACCGSSEPGGKGGWHRDHDHATGEFRGWLCHSCNVGLGHFGDGLAGVYAAVRYLEDGPCLR